MSQISDVRKLGNLPKSNNFDMLRLVLAWSVVFCHCYALSHAAALSWINRWVDGTTAVQGFFAISGCLIVASYDRNPNIKNYFQRRAERILPAYYAAIAFCLVLGSVFSCYSWTVFFQSSETWKYLAVNSVFLNTLHPDLPGVFRQNLFPYAMDGALWTIKIEVMFYAFVPILSYLCRMLGNARVLVSIFILSLAYHEIFHRLHREDLAKQLPGQLGFFLVGAAVYYYNDQFQRYRASMWGLALLSTALIYLWPMFLWQVLGVPLLVLCFGLLFPVFRGPTIYGDFSYGTYVFHFPIIQAIVALGLFRIAPYGATAAVVGIVVVVSVASWYIVERRFLKRVRTKALGKLARTVA
jgi:peptidoglycan/LPS O-acetylase OafA/YrhL